jgi:hypothetical protein
LDKINNRDRSLGNYSVVDGRLYFPIMQDYFQTRQYLATANTSVLDIFRNSISIETPAKAYDAFMTALSL